MAPRKPRPLFARRMDRLQLSGIRKIYDLAARLENPVNLSLGQPDFETPREIQDAAIDAIRSGKNGYVPTPGIPELQDKLREELRRRAGFTRGKILVTPGVSAALFLAMGVLVEKGDEVIVPDPYFSLYWNSIRFFAGIPVLLDTYPDFRIDPDRLDRLISPRTKLILLNNPVNPTGVAYTSGEVAAVAEVARRRKVMILSDEIYASYSYDFPHESLGLHADRPLIVGGFGKAYAITGWRLGFAAGPDEVIDKMTVLQQFSFVCAPSFAQYAGVAALDVKVSKHRADYRRKRDFVYDELKNRYDIARPQGAFYFFPKCPGGLRDTEFVNRAIQRGLLIVPGSACSRKSTHFRMSYAVPDRTLERGVEILKKLARTV
ncbi:MAG TPA: aminotransferase class I/II-fold pyridoxal phosphate-dependent enzyme [Planctomycetota bacterium]|nr:aminotransferase class I/II-fold pyridoxal phosphate-dependent enzyme [Planctomycetota bacterium]